MEDLPKKMDYLTFLWKAPGMAIPSGIPPTNPSLYRINRHFSLPDPLVRRFGTDPLLRDLFPIWTGYFEYARTHGINRPKGINNHLAIFCLEGRGQVTCEGKMWRIGPGDLFLLKADRPHSYQTDEKNPWSIQWVHFIGASVKEFLKLLDYEKSFGKLGPVRHLEDPETLVALKKSFEKMTHAYENGFGLLDCVRASLALREIFLLLAEHEKPPETSKLLGNKPAVDSILKLMKNKVYGDFSLEEMAAGANLSVTHFSRLFRSQTGFSPTDYFIRLKIRHASQKILATQTGIREVAREFGFDDEYYFSRIFKKITGGSPRRYRETHRV